jgi:uncharacterized protein YbbC (DUF1343 family)
MTRQSYQITLGLEKLLNNEINILKGKRLGLVCNQASVDHQFRHAADLFFQHPDINLTTLFGPQHGIRGDVQDNMIETSHVIDKVTGLPIYSLYSETRKPTAEMFENIDALVFDLQDVGCRVYTFIYTMAYCMKAAGQFGKKIIICDRPNPINGLTVEGNVLEKGHESFVGLFPIAMRHAMTTGELAGLFAAEFGCECDFQVVTMNGWRREMWYDETDGPWVYPSPNMPTVDTSVVFPGTVLFEGTQLSEGRGTTRPFEIIGAPFIQAEEFASELTALNLPGVIFRACEFLPTFQKQAGIGCGGVQLHITDRQTFKPVITGVALIKTAYQMYKNDFKWKNPPYEYVFDRNPFDVIAGTNKLRISLENNLSLTEIEDSWTTELEGFASKRSRFLLYE